MRKIKYPSKEIIPDNRIKNLIKIKTKLCPFKTEQESEDFFKKLIEEEMLLSNDYNFTNMEKLLNLYIKGINLYQNTSQTKEIYYFQEKINSLLNTQKAKTLIKEDKKKTEENKKNRSKLTLDNEDNLNIKLLRSKTYKDNVTLNRNKLNSLNRLLKRGMKEKEYQKKKIDEINNEFSDMKNQFEKTSIFLQDEMKKQSTTFKEKLLKKKTIVQKTKKYLDDKLNIIKEEKYKENINKDENDLINKNENSIGDNKNNIKNSLKEKIKKYFDEYNENIYNFYFLNTIRNISQLANQNISINIKINDEYQNNIKDLLKQQIEGNNNITDEDIDSLKEEQNVEIQKNDDLYEKYIEEEISKFKLFGHSNSSPKELEMLKNKIKCEIYNDLYNILSNK